MKIISTVEARMGSSRFPGKSLAPILGRPMLEMLVERLRFVAAIDQVVIATTTEPQDDAIARWAGSAGVGIYRGSSHDVLDRVLKAAREHEADLIVEICGDCPLIDPETVTGVIDLYREGGYDYVSNILCEGYPRGLDTQIFSTALLAEVAELTSDPADREHVSLFIYEHPERYRLGCLETDAELRRRQLRLTVDTPEDLELIRAIFERLHPDKPDFTIHDVLTLLDAHPELSHVNAHIQQKPVR